MNLASRISTLVALVSLVFVVGCGPKVVIVKQASPNPMTATTKFVVAKPTYDAGFNVGGRSEQDWMAAKKDETQDKWAADKVAFADTFVEGFMTQKDAVLLENAQGAGIFGVKTRYLRYEPGHYVGVSSAPAGLDAVIEFVDASGAVVDEIRIYAKADGFSAGERGRLCARQIGEATAKYLKKRIGL
ncbi:MAG: hypothetical protein U0169_20220 [Polyangiaceae bacterium]